MGRHWRGTILKFVLLPTQCAMAAPRNRRLAFWLAALSLDALSLVLPTQGQSGPETEGKSGSPRAGSNLTSIEQAPAEPDVSQPVGSTQAQGPAEEELLVVGRQPPVSKSEPVVHALDIERAKVDSGSALLSLVPGLKMVQHGAEGKGHQVFLRGFDAAHGSDVEVVLHGIALNEPSQVHGQGYLDLYLIIPEAVQRMEVQKGPFRPEQGNYATAGSVDIELGPPPDLELGMFRADVGHRGRLRGVALAAPQEWNRGEDRTSMAAAEAVYDAGFGPQREARRGSFLGLHSFALADSQALQLMLLGQTGRWNSPGTLRLSHVEQGDYGFWDAYEEGTGQGLSDRILSRIGLDHEGETTHLELAAYGAFRRFAVENNYTGFLLDPQNGDRKRQSQDGGTTGAFFELDQELRLPFTASFASGGGWRWDFPRQNATQIDAEGEAWQANRRLGLQLHQLYLYVGLPVTPWPWLMLSPSLRADLFLFDIDDMLADRTARDALAGVFPRVTVTFPVGENLALFAKYGRGFRAPEARSVVAPPPLSVEDEPLSQYAGGRPEIAKADAVDVGAAVAPWRRARIQVTGFAVFVEREIVFDHVSNLNLELDGTRRLGLELSAQATPQSWLDLQADVTWVDARFNASRNPVPGTSPWLATANLHLGEARGVHGGLQAFVVGRRNLAHGAVADGYLLIDVDAGWRFEHLDLAAVVDNLLNSQIMEGVYHFASWFDMAEARSAIPRIHQVAGRPFTARLVLTVFV